MAELREIIEASPDTFEASLDMWDIQNGMGIVAKAVEREYKVYSLKCHWADARLENIFGVELHSIYEFMQSILNLFSKRASLG